MKKSLITFLLVLTFAVYIVYYRLLSSSDTGVIPITPEAPVPTNNTQNIPPAPAPTTTLTAPSTQTMPPKTMPPVKMPMRALYRDGQYAGVSADAYYGNVQVKAIISGGRITDVQFLDHPQDQRTSQRINDYAMPILISEAIQVQSANVDIVSGATDTSGAFRQSLASALAQAKN